MLASVHCVEGVLDFLAASQADMEAYILWIVVSMETADNLAAYTGASE